MVGNKTVNPDTYLIIPVYNEGKVIGGVIAGAIKQFQNVVCVDDGSQDESAAVIADSGARLIRHPINLGQGASLQTGLEYALRDQYVQYFVTFDADGQHRLEDAEKMVRELRQGDCDIVIGSRFLDSSTKVSPLKRNILKLATIFGNVSSGTKLTDAHNGLRAFSRRFAEKLEITMPDMAHASEITVLIGKSGLKYKEIPVTIHYSDYSKAKGQSLWNSVNIMFDLFFDYLTKGRK